MLKKINIFIFAAHHSSNNIASQRFRGLLKYLDFNRYRVFIFSREPVEDGVRPVFADAADITVIEIPGSCVGSSGSMFGTLLVMLGAFLPSIPFLAHRMLRTGDNVWMVRALLAADALCGERLAEEEVCIALGTYSPLDASVAAHILSSRYSLPCVQDFRDGLTFEALGREGRFRALLKRAVEKRIINSSRLVTSVSKPIVEDFELRYPQSRVRLLPNGYDPEDFVDGDVTSIQAAARVFDEYVPHGKYLLGHFGRIGASDRTRIASLECLVRSINSSTMVTSQAHVIFAGQLTETETQIVSELRCSFSMVGSVARPVALALMKRCRVLLLITGDGVGCATGKLFEYLAAGPSIICFSGVLNEASSILESTCAGDTVLSSEDAKAQTLLERAIGGPGPSERKPHVAAYSKIEQVKQLDEWLTEMESQ